MEKLIDEIKEEQNAIDFDKFLYVKTDGKTRFLTLVFLKIRKSFHQTFIIRVH